MLGRPRALRPEGGSPYSVACPVACAVAWANLRRRYPGARIILVTGASNRDDAAVAAEGLAEAAWRSDGSSVLVMMMDVGRQDWQALATPAGAVRIIGYSAPAQVRAAIARAGEAFVVVVSPAPQHGPDYIALADAADVAILVASSGRTRFGEAQLAARLLRQAGLATAVALLLTKRTLRGRKVEEVRHTRFLGHSEGIAEN